MMALPKQVQAQLDEAEALEKELKARREKPEDAPVAEPENAESDTSGDEPEPNASETKASEKKASGKEQEPEDAKPADTPPTDVEETFERKYNTLLGKYNAEVPRLHQQNRDLSEKLEALEAKVAELSKPKEPTKAKEKVSYVTDADREEFGEELIDVQRRVAREVAEEFQDKIDAQASVIEELKQRLGEADGRIGHVTFSQRLAQLVPDFEQVDSDPRWIEWLGEYDPMLRGPRRDQAQKAFNAGDAEAVADYVRLFKESITDTPKPEEHTRQAELEKQVAPARTAGSQRTQSNGKEPKVWRQNEMQRAWEKIRVLNTRGQAEEAAKLEAELTAAYLEGRVRA